MGVDEHQQLVAVLQQQPGGVPQQQPQRLLAVIQGFHAVLGEVHAHHVDAGILKAELGQGGLVALGLRAHKERGQHHAARKAPRCAGRWFRR